MTLHCAFRWIVLMSLSMCGACSTVGYYAQLARGQAQLATQAKPIAKVIAAPATDAALAARLRLTQEARRFASTRLGLPDNRSYTRYVDLRRPYVVWNVFAATRYSVDPILHCFPIAGCVPYRGYFDQKCAAAEAARLQARGDDVYVGGVTAYSTLGWFADPILSTMLRRDDDELIGTIFHELAHQLLYIKGDTAFNESFAMFVQDEGLREWHAARNEPPGDTGQRRADDDVVRLVLDLRERLRTLYAAMHAQRAHRADPTSANDAALDAAKEQEIAEFRTRYAQWRATHWPDDHRYDAFVAGPITNATLLPFGLYDQWLPAFATLFRDSGGDWPRFYSIVRELGHMDPSARERKLQTLAVPASPTILSAGRS